MDNYYERLEVSKKASPEIIEKAYKVLAKKYHPDMHEEDKKEWAEAEFKKISEAYEILSDEEKRKEYDESIKDDYITKEQYEKLILENVALKKKIYSNNNYDIKNIQSKEEISNAIKKTIANICAVVVAIVVFVSIIKFFNILHF